MGITQDEYTKKAYQLKQRQHDIDQELAAHTYADEEYADSVKYLLELCTRAYELFKSSKVEQKRQLLNYVLSNTQLKDGKLLITARKPFDVILTANQRSAWQGLEDVLRTRYLVSILELKKQIQLFFPVLRPS